MSHQHCLFYAGVAHDRVHRAREQILRLGDFWFIARAVAGQINQQASAFFVDRSLQSPERQITGPRVNEHDGFFPRSVALVMDALAVKGGVSRRRIPCEKREGRKSSHA